MHSSRPCPSPPQPPSLSAAEMQGDVCVYERMCIRGKGGDGGKESACLCASGGGSCSLMMAADEARREDGQDRK